IAQSKHPEAHVPRLATAGKEMVVEFVHVPLVVKRRVEGRYALCARFGIAFIRVPVEFPRHSPPNHPRSDREEHEAVFSSARMFFFLLACRELACFAFRLQNGRFVSEYW